MNAQGVEAEQMEHGQRAGSGGPYARDAWPPKGLAATRIVIRSGRDMSPETLKMMGDVRRASMDLTRVLADMRQRR